MTIVAVRYFQSAANLSNPLIPESLLTGIRNFSTAMVVIYAFVVFLNVFYLLTRKLFWPVVILSMLILCSAAYFNFDIHDYFISNAVN